MNSYTNYRDMPDKIKNKQSFNGNSVIGIRYNNSYTIKSYVTEIFNIDFLTGVKTFNYNYYSVTTSKIQRIILNIFYGGQNLKEYRKLMFQINKI